MSSGQQKQRRKLETIARRELSDRREARAEDVSERLMEMAR